MRLSSFGLTVKYLLLFFDRPLKLDWARVIDFGGAQNVEITEAVNVHSVVPVHVSATDIAIEADSVIVTIVRGLNHVKAVGQHVRVLSAPGQKLDLLDGDVASQVVHFRLWVAAVTL